MKKHITYKDLVAMTPCYHPENIGIKKRYKTTIKDFINEYRDKVKNKEDILWVLCRNDYMTDKDMRLFAVWCAREALKLVDNPDPRSINACDVAERYANGEATSDELAAAGAAASAASAAGAAASAASAAWAAARSTARAAAWAARAAARSAARAAAWAARAAARSAAWDAAGAARAAAWAAAGAARDAAWDAARDAQIDKLLTYFK